MIERRSPAEREWDAGRVLPVPVIALDGATRRSALSEGGLLPDSMYV
jgi:hypothetical protein